MIGFVKILMALKIKDQNLWFLSQTQEDNSNKLFVQSHFPITFLESVKNKFVLLDTDFIHFGYVRSADRADIAWFWPQTSVLTFRINVIEMIH